MRDGFISLLLVGSNLWAWTYDSTLTIGVGALRDIFIVGRGGGGGTNPVRTGPAPGGGKMPPPDIGFDIPGGGGTLSDIVEGLIPKPGGGGGGIPPRLLFTLGAAIPGGGGTFPIPGGGGMLAFLYCSSNYFLYCSFYAS
jgi:hypothetical protein